MKNVANSVLPCSPNKPKTESSIPSKLWVGVALSSWLVACGGAQATKELVTARKTYNEAASGEAAQLVPDKLLIARQALDKAEKSHRDDGGSLEEKTLAYIADRRARLAISQAAIRAATDRSEKFRATYEDERERSLRQTQTELERAREKINSSTAELERERQARIAAEERAAAAIASLEEVANVKEERRGTVITLQGAVLFKTGVAELLPLARQQLDRVASALIETDESRQIVVEGHTDSRGSDRSNLQLSQERADSVARYIVSRGLSASRISAVGKGEAEPIASNRTSDGRANNRRVEIVVPPQRGK